MSDLTRRNFCDLQDIKRQAKEEGKKVLLRASVTAAGLHGTYVFVHPADVEPPEGPIPGEHTFHKAYFAAWLWKLTDHCVC